MGIPAAVIWAAGPHAVVHPAPYAPVHPAPYAPAHPAPYAPAPAHHGYCDPKAPPKCAEGSSGSQAAASSPRGSYSSPDASGAGPSYTSPAEFGGNGFGSADAGYGAPGGSDGGFGGAGAGYGAPALGGYSRRNARGLPVDEISEFELASDIEEDIEY